MVGTDQYRDATHDVLMPDVWKAEALLVKQGHNISLFRIACFASNNAVIDAQCVPLNGDPTNPTMTGTWDIQTVFPRLMYWGANGMYPVTRSGQPTAVQYSIDNGATWQWVSDLLKTS